MNSISNWSENLVRECQLSFHHFLPLTDNKDAFLRHLLDNGVIEPELITTDLCLIDNIKNHPAIRWSAQQSENK